MREDSVEIIDNIILCNNDGPNQKKCMFRPYSVSKNSGRPFLKFKKNRF